MTTWKERYPDHREGIRGRQLEDDLLGLDERTFGHRMALMALTRHLRHACLVGNPAPIVAQMSERLRAPRIGDLVVEWMVGLRLGLDDDTRLKAMGYLLAVRDEWYESAADWARFEEGEPEYATEDNRGTDRAWYVQYGPNPADVCRWTNCDFMTVPIDIRMVWEPLDLRSAVAS